MKMRKEREEKQNNIFENDVPFYAMKAVNLKLSLSFLAQLFFYLKWLTRAAGLKCLKFR